MLFCDVSNCVCVSPKLSLIHQLHGGEKAARAVCWCLLLVGDIQICSNFLLLNGLKFAMEPAITVAVIAAAVSAVGWIVNYVLSSRAERERSRLASRLSHIQKQLELLYGPLAFLMLEGRRSFKDLLDKLGRNHVFINNRDLPTDELDLWLFWVDHELMPRNIRVKNLLSAHTHLVVGDRLPDSYVRFLDHHNSWYIEHQRWKEEGVPYAWHSKINWPRDFEDEIISTFEQLMKEHAALIGIIGGTRRA